LLTICMQYYRSSDTCVESYQAWAQGVTQTHTAAAYGRLYPPWDEENSRFYIIEMDNSLNYLDVSNKWLSNPNLDP
jgi:hypothetical protein